MHFFFIISNKSVSLSSAGLAWHEYKYWSLFDIIYWGIVFLPNSKAFPPTYGANDCKKCNPNTLAKELLNTPTKNKTGNGGRC